MWWQLHFNEFITFLLVINPVAALPVFMSIAASVDARTQPRIALYAVVIAFAVLVFFVFAGAFLLGTMKVPIRAFQISGGILLFLVALELIRGDTRPIAERAEQGAFALAVYPLAIPKIAGPGAMLTAILLTDDDRYNPLGQLVTIGMLAAVLLIQLVVLLAAGPITRVIGLGGASVVARVMGMLLAALAVSMVLGAVGDWLNLPKL